MPHPDYDPQLATLVKEPPSGGGWLHEIKYDGYRIGCRIRGGRATLISRNGKDWTAAFPDIGAAAATLPMTNGLLDGEVCIVLPDGRTSFQMLQNAFSGGAAGGTLTYFVFDLLRLDGERLHALPLTERKARLKALVGRRKRAAFATRTMSRATGERSSSRRAGWASKESSPSAHRNRIVPAATATG